MSDHVNRLDALRPVDAAIRSLVDVFGRAAYVADSTPIVEALTGVMEAVDGALDYFLEHEPSPDAAEVAARRERDWDQMALVLS